MSERAKSRLSRSPSKDSDEASGTPHSTPQGTPSRQQVLQEAGSQHGDGGEVKTKSSFFATLDWTDESATAPEDGAPPVQTSEAQVSTAIGGFFTA